MAKRTLQLLYPKRVDNKRRVTASMIDEIINNSNDKTRYPIAIGHNAASGGFFDTDHLEAAGRMSNLRKDDYGSLVGDVDFRDETETKYKDGAYPGWSVGIVKGPEGWAMDHLALLGSRGAAFKDLQEIQDAQFSILEQSDHSAILECFSSDNDKKELWLLQSTPRPEKVEIPKVIESPPEKGETMSKELEEKLKAQETRLEQFETFKAENEELKANLAKLMEDKKNRLTSEFGALKDNVLDAAKSKGVNETARDKLSKAMDGCSELFVAGHLPRELFDAIASTISDLKPKVETGDMFENDVDDDEFTPKSNFSADEATDAILS